MIKRLLLLVGVIISLSSCIEIIDDLSINADGSGSLQYIVNLSSSKVKINSILALDSLDGKKVPELDDIKNKFNEIVTSLKTKEGIEKVEFTPNYDDFIIKLKIDFASIPQLQNAVRSIIKEENESEIEGLEQNWLTYDSLVFNRSVPPIFIEKSKTINLKDRELLNEGTYTSITRFDKIVNRCERADSKISANRKNVMIRANVLSLTKNPDLLDNTIYLSPEE